MSREDRQRVADYIRARRGDLGLSQEQLADKAKVALKTVTNVESGTTWPQAASRAKLESALGLASGDIVRIGRGGEPAPTAPEMGELPPEFDRVLDVDPRLRGDFMKLSVRRRMRLLALYREAQKELEAARRRSDEQFRQVIETFVEEDHPAAD
jgi:transcriptional regulator with XRE-family HTH domain